MLAIFPYPIKHFWFSKVIFCVPCFTFGKRITHLQACETHEANGTLYKMIARVSPSSKILRIMLLPEVCIKPSWMGVGS